MTPRDKLRALLAKAEELEAKATPGPWEVPFLAIGVFAKDQAMRICDIRGWGHLTGAGAMNLPAEKAEKIQEANCNLIALSRNGFLPVLRLLVERLDECNSCHGTGIDEGKWSQPLMDKLGGPCYECTPRYAALCAELEKLGVMGKEET